jgi:hypothetical protein
MYGRKKIILVSNAFYPEISPRSYRATELAKEFYRQGHQVTVITKFRKYDYSGFFEDYKIRFEMWNKPVLPRVPVFKSKPFSFISRVLGRVLALLFEYPSIEETFFVRKALRKRVGFDLMISFAVPYTTHWGVAWARTKTHQIAGTWIADCGDPYMGDVMDSFRKPFYFGYIEKCFFRKTDYISIPVHGAIDGYYSEFHGKIKVIPQGFDFDLEEELLNENPNNGIPEFAYSGTFIKGSRDPGPLMDFLTKVDLPFRFHIFTNMQDVLADYKEILKDKLIISDYIPRSELMVRLSGMDFLINFDNNSTRHVPSKLIDYALTKRPVLNIQKEFKEDQMLSFLKGDYSNRMSLPDPEQYHILNVSKLFLKLC